MEDVSKHIKNHTGWVLKPTGGMLHSREFLNSLAFKVCHCTQYIRHEQSPIYSPEPDAFHELLGHAPMLMHQDYADYN